MPTHLSPESWNVSVISTIYPAIAHYNNAACGLIVNIIDFRC